MTIYGSGYSGFGCGPSNCGAGCVACLPGFSMLLDCPKYEVTTPAVSMASVTQPGVLAINDPGTAPGPYYGGLFFGGNSYGGMGCNSPNYACAYPCSGYLYGSGACSPYRC